MQNPKCETQRKPKIVALLLILTATVSYAHPVPRQTARELIRIQGYRTTEPPAATKHQLTLVALGSEHSFAATGWQVFGFAEDANPTATPDTAKQRFALQGSREDLAKFASSRPDQRVTLLAEHRPGSADLFIVALDLCPE